MWSLLSSHVLSVWMPVCTVHGCGTLFLPSGPLRGQHQSTTREVGFWMDLFWLFHFNLWTAITFCHKHTNNAHVIRVGLTITRTDCFVFFVRLDIFGCLFMYIKIFVLITVLYVQIKKNLHFQDKAVDELLKKKKRLHLILNKVTESTVPSGIINSIHTNKYWHVFYTHQCKVPIIVAVTTLAIYYNYY